MPSNPHIEAARSEVAGRLDAYREARAAIHDDIRRAAELGMTQAEIARRSGLTRQWVARVLQR